MAENWYELEQRIRDRLTEARAAARIRTLTQKLAPATRRPNFVGITISRVANWVRILPLALSRSLAKVRAATK